MPKNYYYNDCFVRKWFLCAFISKITEVPLGLTKITQSSFHEPTFLLFFLKALCTNQDTFIVSNTSHDHCRTAAEAVGVSRLLTRLDRVVIACDWCPAGRRFDSRRWLQVFHIYIFIYLFIYSPDAILLQFYCLVFILLFSIALKCNVTNFLNVNDLSNSNSLFHAEFQVMSINDSYMTVFAHLFSKFFIIYSDYWIFLFSVYNTSF